MNCLGCHLANKIETVHVVFEDEYVCCILDHEPYNEGHVLILPKRHIRYFDELDEDTADSVIEASNILTRVIKELFHPDGITVCQNGGAFDELTHFHMHIVPRYEGRNFADFFTEEGDTCAGAKNRLAETRLKMIEMIKVLG